MVHQQNSFVATQATPEGMTTDPIEAKRDAILATLQRRPTLDLVAAVSLFGATWASESFAFGKNGYTPWFPPAAIMLWVLLLAGPTAIPTLVAGRLFCDWFFYRGAIQSWPRELAVTLFVVFSYAAGSGWIRKRVTTFERLREMGWFVAVGAVASPLCAALSVLLFNVAVGDAKLPDALIGARTFFIGDAVAIATIVPVLARLCGLWRRDDVWDRGAETRSGRIEATVQGMALILVPVILFALGNPGSTRAYLPLAVLPALAIALRGTTMQAQLAALFMTIALTVGARIRFGATADLVQLQAVMLATAFATLYAIAVVRSQRRQSVEDRLRQASRDRNARTDSLTRTANRLGMLEFLATPTPTPTENQSNTQPVVLSIDVDRFSNIVDAVGYQDSDRFLTEFAQRVTQTVGTLGLVARLDQDHFAVGLRSSDPADADLLAASILSAIRKTPFLTEPIDIGIWTTGSIGKALGRTNELPEDLLRNADIAMRQAKGRGGNTLSTYDPAQRFNAESQSAVLSGLRKALRTEDSLFLLYQPVIDLSTGALVAAEGLIRWRQSDGTLVSPSTFIPLAEQSGLIGEIGEFVLRSGIAQLAEWGDAVPLGFRLHLNVSPRQLTDPGLADELAERCQKLGVPTDRLCLELTETHLATDPGEAMEALQRLSNIGCHLALDDFGTGFSTIGWLSRFPIDTLKIDQTFVSGMATKADDRSIVRLIIQLANELNLELIAEGIETAEQHDLLREYGCANGQGYRFSRPIGAEIITERLRSLDWIPSSN